MFYSLKDDSSGEYYSHMLELLYPLQTICVTRKAQMQQAIEAMKIFLDYLYILPELYEDMYEVDLFELQSLISQCYRSLKRIEQIEGILFDECMLRLNFLLMTAPVLLKYAREYIKETYYAECDFPDWLFTMKAVRA